MKSRTRDLLSDQGTHNGKGDADRTTDDAAFRANLAEIPHTPVSEDPTFTKVGGRYRKVYGTPEPKPEQTRTKPIIH